MTTSGDEASASRRRRLILERLTAGDRALLSEPYDSSTDVEMKELSWPVQLQMPDVSGLLASIEDDVVINELNEKVCPFASILIVE